MNCKPMEHRQVIMDETGAKYAPLASFDANEHGTFHIVATDQDFVVMVQNGIDAGIYRPHRAHEPMPAEVAAMLVTTAAQVMPPKAVAQKAMAALLKDLEPKPLKLGG